MVLSAMDNGNNSRRVGMMEGWKSSANSPTLAQPAPLTEWENPLPNIETEGPEDEPISGLDAAFQEIEKQIQEECDEDAEEAEESEGEAEVAPKARGKTTKGKGKKKVALPSLMNDELYAFDLVQDALDAVVPKECIEEMSVVLDEPSDGGWDPQALLLSHI
ncbi:hypothetical protein GGX14DRAFT_398401 [Mycena pura]|uniref:Uncharacterized protein n=1 Tax=Mycena pura TaxID=153505 RepID=A0AAD6V6E8_9AGAR|nr:hypothetical protein GGX14DRAFT_398401 [Mycena pura]